jgi:hypothetical protein
MSVFVAEVARPTSSQEDEPWQIIENLIGIDVAKVKNAIAVAESGRGEKSDFGVRWMRPIAACAASSSG